MPDHVTSIQSAVPIASCTKIMTCLVVLQSLKMGILSLDHQVTISSQVANVNNSSANLKQNCAQTVLDLLFGMMLPSGNDAAVALALEFGKAISERDKVDGIVNLREKHVSQGNISLEIGGNREDQIKDDQTKDNSSASSATCNESHQMRFVKEMNIVCKINQLNNSIFSNVNGYNLSEGKQRGVNTMSAQDLARLFNLAMRQQLFVKIISTREQSSKLTQHTWHSKAFGLGYSKNLARGIWQIKQPSDLHINIENMVGGKTGSSELSKFCQCTCVLMKDTWLVQVTLGSETLLSRKQDVEELVSQVEGNIKKYNIRFDINGEIK